MGQGEVLQFLKENEGQMFTEKEICMAMDLTVTYSSLSRLRKYPPEGFNFFKSGIPYFYWYKKKRS